MSTWLTTFKACITPLFKILPLLVSLGVVAMEDEYCKVPVAIE